MPLPDQVFEPWVAALDGITEYERLQVLTGCTCRAATSSGKAPAMTASRVGPFRCAHPCGPIRLGRNLSGWCGSKAESVLVRGLDCLDGTPLIDLKPDRCAFTPLAPRQSGDDQVGDAP